MLTVVAAGLLGFAGINGFILFLDAGVLVSWAALLMLHGTTAPFRLALMAILVIVTYYELGFATFTNNQTGNYDDKWKLLASAGVIKSIANFATIILWGSDNLHLTHPRHDGVAAVNNNNNAAAGYGMNTRNQQVGSN